jgi:hypothetical protein
MALAEQIQQVERSLRRRCGTGQHDPGRLGRRAEPLGVIEIRGPATAALFHEGPRTVLFGGKRGIIPELGNEQAGAG